MTDARGYVTRFSYDEVGRKIREMLPDPDGTGPLAPLVTRWFYDPQGNVQYVVNALGSDAKEAEYTTEYVRDNLGRVVREILPDPDGGGTGAGRPITESTYDSNGNLASVKDALDRETLYLYDRRDRPAKATDALGSYAGDPAHTTVTWYDAVGNVPFVTDALGRLVGYQYDWMNRVTKEILPKPNYNDAQPEIGYAYDASGNLVSTVDPLGYTTWYQYDGWNRQTHVTDALGYRSGDPAHTTVTVFDALGNVAAVTDALGRTIDYSYDHLGRMTVRYVPDTDCA